VKPRNPAGGPLKETWDQSLIRSMTSRPISTASARIEALPTTLDVVCRTTGMGFAAVARVSEDRWVAYGVLDEIDFGLKLGGELRVETTICHEIRQCREPVTIDHVAEDEARRNHPTTAMYGFQSYISMPIILADGSFFGALCAIDPRPARVKTPGTIGMFRLFAELIAKHLDAGRRLFVTETALQAERAESEHYEQFIAVLAHDLRTPMRSINTLTELMMQTCLEEEADHGQVDPGERDTHAITHRKHVGPHAGAA